MFKNSQNSPDLEELRRKLQEVGLGNSKVITKDDLGKMQRKASIYSRHTNSLGQAHIHFEFMPSKHLGIDYIVPVILDKRFLHHFMNIYSSNTK